MNAISCLQEYMQRMNKPFPVYDVIDHKVLPTSNIFTVRAIWGKFRVNGIALNKKSAKLVSAVEMIAELNKNGYSIPYNSSQNSRPTQGSPKKIGIDTPIETPDVVSEAQILDICSESSSNTSVNTSADSSFSTTSVDSLLASSSSMPNTFFINSVGKLQELCVKHNLLQPEYIWDLQYVESGHKIICKLGDMQEVGVAQTKRLAKHVSAENMRQRMLKMLMTKFDQLTVSSELPSITKLPVPLIDSVVNALENITIEDTLTVKASAEKAKTLYSKLIKPDWTPSSNEKSIPVKEYHTYFKNSLEADKLRKVCSYFKGLTLSFKTVADLEIILNNICSILDVENKETMLTTKAKKKHAVVFAVHIIPLCMQIGIGNTYNDAKLEALIRSIEALRLLLS